MDGVAKGATFSISYFGLMMGWVRLENLVLKKLSFILSLRGSLSMISISTSQVFVIQVPD